MLGAPGGPQARGLGPRGAAPSSELELPRPNTHLSARSIAVATGNMVVLLRLAVFDPRGGDTHCGQLALRRAGRCPLGHASTPGKRCSVDQRVSGGSVLATGWPWWLRPLGKLDSPRPPRCRQGTQADHDWVFGPEPPHLSDRRFRVRQTVKADGLQTGFVLRAAPGAPRAQCLARRPRLGERGAKDEAHRARIREAWALPRRGRGGTTPRPERHHASRVRGYRPTIGRKPTRAAVFGSAASGIRLAASFGDAISPRGAESLRARPTSWRATPRSGGSSPRSSA
jgi:hypothetical protein